MGNGEQAARVRCEWVPADRPAYVAYHDHEWGVPVLDSRKLFAKLILDGFQAGLSWWSVLSRRDGFYAAFDGLEPEAMARYDQERIEALLNDPRIIRNRQKVVAAVGNARAYMQFEASGEDFGGHLWSFVGGAPHRNAWTDVAELPASTEISKTMSRDLRERGFRFVGPTICYAFMQAVGMVNDHTVDCFRYVEVAP